MVCGPTTLMPKFISELGVKVSHNVREALEWCDVANVLRIQLERQATRYFPSLREYTLHFGINRKLLEAVGRDITIMHPGPINRGVEIDSSVADGRQSVILPQVTFGIAVRMAVMSTLAGNEA